MKKYPTKVKICCPMCEGKGFMEIENQQLLPRNPYIGKQETKDLRNKLRKLNRDKLLAGKQSKSRYKTRRMG
jgi:hypothetical protein